MAERSEEKRVKRRYSIFWVLSILMVALVVGPLFFYSQKAIDTSKAYITDSLRERQLRTASPAAGHIEDMIRERQRHLQNLVHAFEVFASDDDALRRYEDLIERDILSRYITPECAFLMYLDRRGNHITASKELGYLSEDQIFFDTMRNQGLRCLGDNNPQATQVFSLALPNLGGGTIPVIIFTEPIRGGDSMVGAISALFLLDEVHHALREYGEDFTIFVTDIDRRLIFHSDAGLSGTGKDMTTDPVAGPILGTGQYPKGSRLITVPVEGDTTYLVSYTPIPDYQWILFTVVDRDQYFTPAHRLETQSKIWIVTFVLIAVVVGFFFTKLITKPITDLTEFSRCLARKEFDKRADISVRNELGELAGAFNYMAKEMGNYISRLQKAAEENEQLFMNSIRAIANAIDAKDPYTRGHSERVSDYSMIIARELGLSAPMMRVIEISSMLHDVGKIGIGDKILRKPGALTNEEFEIMKTHPGKGAEILSSIPQMKRIIPGIRHHHEKWQGGGYPDGLQGDQIPPIARIIGIADAFDAMTTNRPYQRAMTFAMAAARVNELTPKVYDPRMVEGFNRAYKKGLFHRYQAKTQTAMPAQQLPAS